MEVDLIGDPVSGTESVSLDPLPTSSFMSSLRGRLFALWFMLLASAAAMGVLLFAFYRQSSAIQVAQAEEAVTRGCQDLTDRYAFFSAGWTGADAGRIDDALRRDLTGVVQAALGRATGVEGGIWQRQAGSLAYAYPTYEGTGPKTDLPAAELPTIAQANVDALRSERAITIRSPGRSQVLVLRACPLSGPIADSTAWAMARAFTGQGAAYNQLLAGLGLLALIVLGSALFLGRLLLGWSRRIGGIETALASHDGSGATPLVLPLTGERELDRLIVALNTADVRLAEARRRSMASERLAAVGSLAAGMAHEIRNPIAAMRLKAENALASGDEGRRAAALTAVLHQIARLDGLLYDLLAMTQPRAPRPVPTDIHALLSRCAELHRESANAKGIAISVEAPRLREEDWPELDPDQVGRALDNLMLNAVQNLPSVAGGSVRLSAIREGSKLNLCVSDKGPGVPAALRDRVFEPFVTGRTDGTGIGLAIVRETARAHGGEVRLVPAEIGATFEMSFPWRQS